MATNQGPAPQLPAYTISTLSRAFSKNSRRYQRYAHWAVNAALILIAISTIVSAFHVQSPHVRLFGYSINGATAIAAIFFLVASLIRLYRIARGPERIWFTSRELAEHTRSLAWQYAVAGGPFQKSTIGPDTADANYQHELDKTDVQARDSGIRARTPSASDGIHVITDWMRAARDLPLDARRALYARDRIANQETFYMTREHEKGRAATTSQWTLYIIEIVGAVLAALNALSIIQLDLVGVAGTIAAGVAAWVQFNQFTELAGTYGAMAYRMAAFRERCLSTAQPWNEERWAAFVGEVEGTLAEEHGAWRHIVQQGATDMQ